MVNKPKIKGTIGETKVVNYIVAAGIFAERLALKGNNDQGDVRITRGGHPHIHLEVKAGKQTLGYNRSDKADWLNQARIEGINSGTTTFLVIAKHGRNEADFEVWSATGDAFWYLDDFIKMLGGTPRIFKGGKPVG